MRKTRILLVDDHQVVRRGVAAILSGRPDWEICGEASTGREAIAAALQLDPDLVVMDISMPDMNGLEATRQIIEASPQTGVLILSMHESEHLVRDVLASGARGCILKTNAGDDLLTALNSVRRHKLFFTSKVAEVVLRGYRTGESESKTPTKQLSSREREIVRLLAEGNSTKDVAATLNISVKTVGTHRAHIRSKLGLHSISALVRYAIRNHIIEC